MRYPRIIGCRYSGPALVISHHEMAGFSAGIMFNTPHPLVFVRIWRHVFQLQWR